jgi:hypothetical protein
MAKKETPKLSEMKAPRRKAAVSYTPRRNPEAEKIMGSQAARERIVADRAVNSRFSGESVEQSKSRLDESEDLFTPSPRRAVDAPGDTRRLLRPGMPDPIVTSRLEKEHEYGRSATVWEMHQGRWRGTVNTYSLDSPHLAKTKDEMLHELSVKIHKDTVTHGQACESDRCGVTDHTMMQGGVRIHGVGMDEAGFSSDPRMMGTLRADGTRVGERAKTLDEIKKGLDSRKESTQAPALGPIEKIRRRAQLTKMTEEKNPDVTPENMAPTLVERIKSGDTDAEKFDRDMNIGRNTPRRISSIQGTTLEGTPVEDKK